MLTWPCWWHLCAVAQPSSFVGADYLVPALPGHRMGVFVVDRYVWRRRLQLVVPQGLRLLGTEHA